MSHEKRSASCENCILQILKSRAVKDDQRSRKFTKQGLKASVDRLYQPKIFRTSSVATLDCREDLKKHKRVDVSR